LHAMTMHGNVAYRNWSALPHIVMKRSLSLNSVRYKKSWKVTHH
jgi:hypothetical protein